MTRRLIEREGGEERDSGNATIAKANYEKKPTIFLSIELAY